MDQFYNVFNSCRAAEVPKDRLKRFFKTGGFCLPEDDSLQKLRGLPLHILLSLVTDIYTLLMLSEMEFYCPKKKSTMFWPE